MTETSMPPIDAEPQGKWVQRWKESHASLLILFAVIIIVIRLVQITFAPPETTQDNAPAALPLPDQSSAVINAPNQPSDPADFKPLQDGDAAGPAMMKFDEDGTPVLPPGTMVIQVSTSKSSDQGPIRVAIYDSPDAFGSEATPLLNKTLQPVEGFVFWAVELSRLPSTFAIGAYHDLDSNKRLNRALFNKPTEPYCFSNGVYSAPSESSYAEAMLKRPAAPQLVKLHVH